MIDAADVIERLAINMYHAYCDVRGVRGARWELVDPRHKESVWRERARAALVD